MNRIRTAIACLLFAASAHGDTDIYVNLSDLTWVGSGTEFWASWGSAETPDRTDFGAWMHLDATYADGMTIESSNGTNFVSRWDDWRDNGAYAARDIYFDLFIPFVASSFQNGKSVMRFQPFAEGGRDAPGPMLRFSTDRAGDIFAVFAAIKIIPNGTYIPFLGGDQTYDFHGSTGGQLIHPDWSSARVNQGTNAIDGAVQTVATIYPTNTFHVVSVRTSGGGVSANNLGRDRNFRAGGIDFAELLIFTNPVSDAVAQSIENYLGAKWGIAITH